jgi:hypothetical protein
MTCYQIKVESLQLLQQIQGLDSSCTDLQEDHFSPTNAPNCTAFTMKIEDIMGATFPGIRNTGKAM